MKRGKEEKKGFVWYSLRVSFWALVGLYILVTVLGTIFPKFAGLPVFLPWVLSLLLIILMVFIPVISIIHLVKHKRKLLAIIALVFSLALVALTVISLLFFRK